MWNCAENQMMLVMIRHGATKSNREHRYLGKVDEPLSEEGIEELSRYKNAQCYPTVDYLFASPMKRCIQTAEILYPNLQPVWIADWKEMDFGAFEGKNYMELQGDRRYQAFVDSNGTLPFPDGESQEAFIMRCYKGFQGMLQELQRMDGHNERKKTGMIVHGGTIMALLSSMGGGDYFDYQAANGKGYTCILEEENGRYKFTEIESI